MLVRKTIVSISIALLTGAGLLACKDTYVDPAVTAATENDITIQQYNTAEKINATKTASGLYYVINTANPTGKLPAIGDEVAFTYKLSSLQHTVLDSTRKDTLVYSLFGLGVLQAGLEEGLGLMHVGESATLLVPSSLAFGSRVIIPTSTSATSTTLASYSPVRFDVNLVASRTEDEQIDQFVADSNLVVTEKTTTGLRLIKTKDNPSGQVVANGQTVVVKYTGKHIRSTTAFSSGTTTVIVGKNQIISGGGVDEGLRKLKVGEQARLIFPSSLGYGITGLRNQTQNNSYIIPPYSPLVYDVQIVSAQ